MTFHWEPPLFIWFFKNVKVAITDCHVPELIPVLCSQPAGDMSHKLGDRLPLLSARPAVTLTTLNRAATSFIAGWTEAWWREQFAQDCYPTASWLRSEPRPWCAWVSSTLTTRLLSHPSDSLGTDKGRTFISCYYVRATVRVCFHFQLRLQIAVRNGHIAACNW